MTMLRVAMTYDGPTSMWRIYVRSPERTVVETIIRKGASEVTRLVDNLHVPIRGALVFTNGIWLQYFEIKHVSIAARVLKFLTEHSQGVKGSNLQSGI